VAAESTVQVFLLQLSAIMKYISATRKKALESVVLTPLLPTSAIMKYTRIFQPILELLSVFHPPPSLSTIVFMTMIHHGMAIAGAQ
jgi:hypothetical protein